MSLNLDARQRAMLKEMGVKVWWPTPAEPSTGAPLRAKIAPDSEAKNTIETSRKPVVESIKTRPTSPATLGASSRAPTTAPTLAPTSAPTPPIALQAMDASRVAAMDWRGLQDAVASCQACGLCHTRKKTVFGAGPGGDKATDAPQVDCLIVGEAPGDAEDASGEPFVGPAGQLLDNMLKAMGRSRTSGAYVTNVLKCRPPGNRNPNAAEIAQCAPYLQRQIALLRPQVIIAMGRFAVQSLLANSVPDVSSTPLGKLRGHIYAYEGVPVVVTYDPARLLRALPDKGNAWEDLCLAMGLVR